MYSTGHDSVQKFVVIGYVNFKLEHSQLWSNFEFDPNIVSGTGARTAIEGLWYKNLPVITYVWKKYGKEMWKGYILLKIYNIFVH